MRTEKNLLVVLTLLLTVCGCASHPHGPASSVDLTTPESTVTGFTRAAAAGQAELAQAHFLPEGEDYEDIWDVLTAQPSTPPYMFRTILESVDTNAPIPVIAQNQTDHGLAITWRVTFAKGFQVQGVTMRPGDTYDFDATLINTPKGWLIDNF